MAKYSIVVYVFLMGFYNLISMPCFAATLHLKPNAAVGQDAYLSDGTPSSNFSTHPEFTGTAWTCSFNPCNGRGVIKFDISSIPQNAIITSAQLSLFANPNPANGNGIAMQGSNTSILQRITSNWSENTVTWNNAPSITTLNQVILPASTSSFQNYPNIDVKNLVQDMVNNPLSSFGFLLRLQTESAYKSMIFCSSDYSDPTKWPEITINYEVPVISTMQLNSAFYCPGSPVTVSYTSTPGFNSNNIFTAQLSDANGNFNNPINIGAVTATGSGSISAVIPVNSLYGLSYKIRVISTNPAIIGSDNGSGIGFLDPNDNDLCTIDACILATGLISHVPISGITDNNACTNDICDPLTANITHVTLNYNDQNACTFDGCDYLNGVYHISVNIDDGNNCTNDACDPVTAAISHTVINANDQNACTTDGCDYLTGVYHTPAITEDNNACTVDACDQITGVVSHTVINSNDNNLCTFDGCDFITGEFHISVNIDDGNSCTTDACNPATAAISHIVINTDDQNACTTDGCDLVTGVYHTPFITEDNNACTIDACNQVTGIVSHIVINTDDNNLCTFDGCDFITGEFHISVNVDDGNECTIDACEPATAAISHLPVNADDNNECTADGCDPATGVYHNAISFDDYNLCTDDGCNPATGVYHTDVNIDDRDACTADACNPSTGNITHIAADTDDGDPCTIDGCDHTSGQVFHNDNSPSMQVLATTILCYGGHSCITVSATGGQPPYYGTGTFCNFLSGTYTLTVTDSVGCSVSNNMTIVQPDKINILVNAIPSLCAANNGQASVSVIGGTSPYTYLWSPGNQTTSSISGLGAGQYSVTVIDSNGCSESGGIGILVIGNAPPTPGAVSGPAGVCKNQTGVVYSVSPIPGATSYMWTLPGGMSGSSSTNSISVSVSNTYSNGFICVSAVNSCGTSGQSCKNVVLTKNKPGAIAQMSGPSNVCTPSVVTYCIPAVPNATYYNWGITGNGGANPLAILSGQGTGCITLNVPAGYNGNQELKVRAENCMGVSGWRKKNIHKTSVPHAPGNISGTTNVCKSQTNVYTIGSVGGASSYYWSITGGASIVSGQGTKSVGIDFSSSVNSTVVLSVTALNNCGSSAATSVQININLNCKVVSNLFFANSGVSEIGFSAYPNPAPGNMNIAFNSTVDRDVQLVVEDLFGRRLYVENMKAVNGENIFNVELAFLAKGVYLIHMEDATSRTKTVRIVLE